jgi:hypothetical protein
VTRTVLTPVVEDGTVNVAPEKDPWVLVPVVPLRVTEFPPKVAVMAELAAKPDPVTVTRVPTLPLVGLRVIDGITVNIARPEFPLESVTVTV